MALPKLIGHEFVLVPFLLACVQLLGEDQQGFLFTLQLSFTHQVLQNKNKNKISYQLVKNVNKPPFNTPPVSCFLHGWFCFVEFFVFKEHIPREVSQ